MNVSTVDALAGADADNDDSSSSYEEEETDDGETLLDEDVKIVADLGAPAVDDTDIEALRREFSRRMLVYTSAANGCTWHSVVAYALARFTVPLDAEPDLDFVTGKSTGGELYIKENSTIFQSACLRARGFRNAIRNARCR